MQPTHRVTHHYNTDTQNLRSDDTNPNMEKLSSQEAELPVMVKKSGKASAPSDPAPSPRRYGASPYVAILKCSYCGKAGQKDESCWKKMCDGKECHFGGRMRPKQDDCWTKRNLERQDVDKRKCETIAAIQDVGPSAKEPIAAVRRRKGKERLPKQRVVDSSDFSHILDFLN